MKALAAFWRRWNMQEVAVLGLLVAVLGGTLFFVTLARETVEGETHRFDEGLLLALRNPADHSDPIGPPWVEETMRDFTALGSSEILLLITASVAGYLVLVRRYQLAVLVSVAVVGALALNFVLKLGIDRPRPDLVPQLSQVYFTSFPSGHSMGAAATYLTLGAILARVQPRLRLKVYFLSLAILITLLVGISRVYLGVHWPTDVLAGWTAGAVWAMACVLAAWWLQTRRAERLAGPRGFG
jgi:undecaprenyl-diphosphatase